MYFADICYDAQFGRYYQTKRLMKTLYIVRHAKSSWDFDDLVDFDRPLKGRGVNDANDMAARLKNAGHSPELIISSPAARALQTAKIFCKELEIPECQISQSDDIYDADYEDILNVIFKVDDVFNSLMIFGHNPGFTDLANYLGTMNIDNIPSSGIVILKFEASKWKKIGRDHVKEEFFDYPRNESIINY